MIDCVALPLTWHAVRAVVCCAMLQGDILEDIPLIENLEETKRTAVQIAEQVKAAKVGGSCLQLAGVSL
jgi:hypothetical protein